MLPSLHSLQNAVLLLRRQGAEALQPLAQPILPFCRQSSELGIAVECFLLVLGRDVLVLTQPVACVMLFCWTVLTRSILFPAIGATARTLRCADRHTESQDQPSYQGNQRFVPRCHFFPSTSPKASLRSCSHVGLNLQIIEHIEIGIQIVILIELLQIAYRRSRLYWLIV